MSSSSRCPSVFRERANPPTRRIAPRPTRWPAAVAALVDLQEEYRTWLENLPQNLESSKLASKLQTIIELDLEELQAIDPAATAGTDTAKALAPDVIRGSVWRGRPRSGDGAAACGFSMRIILRFRCELRADYACDFRCELRADYTAVSMQTSGRLKVAISSTSFRRFPTGGSELFQPAVSGPQFRPVPASSSRGFRRRFGASSGGGFRPTIFGARLVGAMGPPEKAAAFFATY
jgi:hypothetical protein